MNPELVYKAIDLFVRGKITLGEAWQIANPDSTGPMPPEIQWKILLAVLEFTARQSPYRASTSRADHRIAA